jgi:hypothetical protein
MEALDNLKLAAKGKEEYIKVYEKKMKLMSLNSQIKLLRKQNEKLRQKLNV